MTPEQFLILLSSWWPWLFVKFFVVILLLFYIIFAAICFRQIDLMNQMVEAQISPFLRLIGLIHLLAATGIFFLALIIL